MRSQVDGLRFIIVGYYHYHYRYQSRGFNSRSAIDGSRIREVAALDLTGQPSERPNESLGRSRQNQYAELGD